MKEQISEALVNVLKDLGIEGIEPQLESPTDMQFGDYTTNVALIAAKKVGKNPKALAEEIKNKFEVHSSQFTVIDNVDIAGPGFINFWVKREELVKRLGEGRISKVEGGKVVVEYSSPNIAKPFTIGHLRSTIIGDAVANLLEAVGYEVYRDNHIGDWGTQFGKQIYAVKTWGSEDAIEKAERPVKELVGLYVKFHEEAEKDPALEEKGREWFKKLEQGDAEARRLWQKCIDWSWKEFEEIYKELGVPSREGARFENNGRGYGEAFFEDKMARVIQELEEKKVLQEGKEGAKIVKFDEATKLPPLMIVKKDGASLYATRDLATDRFRLRHYGNDVLVINEVGAEQSLYWEQIFQTEYMLGWYKPGQRVHVKHGMYRFKEGKMSTRKGNVIWLEDVLYEAIERSMILIERKDDKADASGKQQLPEATKKEVARQVGIGAIKWNDLKRDMKQDIQFDWDDILNMQGNSGPYVQYTYARTQSVIRRAGISNVSLGQARDKQFQMSNFKWIMEPGKWKIEDEEALLLRLLYKYEDTVVSAAEKYSPNILCTYLFNLAQEFNVFYQKHSILNPVISTPAQRGEKSPTQLDNAGDLSSQQVETRDDDTRAFRLALTDAVGNTLKHGLSLLGIQAPEQM